MDEAAVDRLLRRREFAAVEADKFPAHIPLSGILRNDTRVVKYHPGDIIVREGDYGNSAFLILDGSVRVVLSPGLPAYMLGRPKQKKKSLLESLAQLWRNRTTPEVRETAVALPSKVREVAGKDVPHVFL